MAILALVMNVPFNYVLMYGKLGFPALGATGCGLATGIANWLILLAMIAYMRRTRGYYSRFELFRRPETSAVMHPEAESLVARAHFAPLFGWAIVMAQP